MKPGWRRAALASVAAAGLAFWRCLPQPLFDAPHSAALYDREGRLLGARVAADGQWRFPPVAAVPEKFTVALVRFEDKRYWRHPGVDPLAIARAARLNARRGEVVSGGSTLSMQVMRLARGNRPRGYGEKAIEIAMALRLELSYDKPEILAFYAANAPFGGNVVGLEAAAWRYFGRSPEQLSWAEATTLAVLPNSPALIHPGRGRELLLRKRDRLLATLHQEGRIDDMQYQLALREPLPAAPQALPRLAPHLLDTLAAAEADGSRHHSTLDRTLQRRVTELLEDRGRQLATQGVHNAAALVIDNQSMQVLAYVGNRQQLDEADRGQAVDLLRRPRSTGSLLKPFLYAAMLQDGQLQPGSLVPDVPMQFAGFRPENFDRRYRGAVRASDALAASLNVPAVHMLRQYGLGRYHDLLRGMGMSTLTRAPGDYGLTLILGGAEGTLWDLGQMYAGLARAASSGEPRGRLRYQDLQVEASVKSETGGISDYGAGAAWLTLDALQEVSRPEQEQHWKNFSSSRRLAWKTGTSQGQRDGWAIGVTPRYTVAVWVGNASGEAVAGLTGASMAAPLMFDVFNGLPEEAWFPMPRRALRAVKVCRNDGYLPSEGCETETRWIPKEAHFERVSRHQQTVHLDASGLWRVDSRCEAVSAMQHRSWFVLPPGQEHYYRMHDTGYRGLPPLRADCRDGSERRQNPFEIVYPEAGAAVYIPTDLGARRGRVVFEAVHRQVGEVLHWHVDDAYVGSTTEFHKLSLDLPPGAHRLTVVDGEGNRQARSFSVLGSS